MPDQTCALQDALRSPAFKPMVYALNRLNAAGWAMKVFAAADGIHVGRGGRPAFGPHLCVSGTDNYGDALTGVIDARGDFYGEPLD